MMKKLLAILPLVFFGLQSSAQNMLPHYLDTANNNAYVDFSGLGFYHSSALKKEMVRKFVQGGFIDDDIKNNSMESMDFTNRFGADISGEITYFSNQSLFHNKPNLSWLVRYGYQFFGAGEFTNDAYELLFYGNSDFKGRQANLSNMHGLFTAYSKLGFGLKNQKQNSVVLNAILVHQFSRFTTGRAGISFQEDLNFIDAVADAAFLQTNSHAAFQGIGFGVDADYHIPIREEGLMNGHVSIVLRNLGMAYLQNVEETRINGAFLYQPFNLDDIVNIVNGERNFVEELEDSLNFSVNSGGQWITLPGMVQVGKVIDANSSRTVQSFFGARAYASRAFIPMVYIGGHYQTDGFFSFGAQTSFGGFGGLRGGAYVAAKKENFSFSLGTEDVLGIFLPTQYGESVVMRCRWKI
ncbi:MAG: hypothetical protein JJT77_05275 [Crocinitomicaceae bacterium]|nr:hypothetical protein [Crocinitomicaceae bacterium]